MPEMTRNGQGQRCPVCDRGILKPRLISEAFEYAVNGDSVLVKAEDIPLEDCDVCGESFSSPKAARIRHEAIGRALRLSPPQDIRAIRERLGQSHDQFARLIGVTTERLTQWEDGTLWQDRTADRLMRLIALSHDNVKHLEAHDADSLREERVAKDEVNAAKPTGRGSTRPSESRGSIGRLGVRPIRRMPLETDPADLPSTSPPPRSSPASSPIEGSSGS
jgi:HTH-type transcriptional regulator/antitoxin MqsA